MSGTRIGIVTCPPAGRTALAIALLAALAIALPATGSAAATQTWRAAVGASGANGTATVTATGTAGTLKLALKALTPSAAYPVRIVKGTCAAPGSTLWTAPTQTSTAAGRIARSLVVPAAKVTAIRAGAATGPIAVRIGSGSSLRCGPFTGGPAPTPTPTPTPEPPLAVTTGASATVGGGIAGIAADDTSVWVLDTTKPLAYRLNLTSGQPTATVDLSDSLHLLPFFGFEGTPALGFGALWIPTLDFSEEILPDVYVGSDVIVRVDTTALTVAKKIAITGTASAAAVGDGSIWAIQSGPDALLRIDPATNTVARTVPLPEKPVGIAVGAGSAWIAAGTKLLRVDTTTYAVTSLDLGAVAHGVAAGDGAVWVAVEKVGSGSARLLRVAPASFSVVASVDVPGSPSGVAAGGGYVWVAPGDKATPTAVAVSASSNVIVASVTLPQALAHVAIRGRSAWFAGGIGNKPTVIRLDY